MIKINFFSLLVAILFTSAAFAEPAKIQTPSPVIHLVDNLDEADGLGWCIDTMGRGFGENLHAHSCKPRGGDVQFSYKADSGQIASVPFEGKCMELIAPGDRIAFGLRDCSADLGSQRFTFNAKSGQITPADSPQSCVAAGSASRSAGPFMSRDLVLVPCAGATSEFITWVVRN